MALSHATLACNPCRVTLPFRPRQTCSEQLSSLSRAELSALILDGAAFRVGDQVLLSDQILTPNQKARIVTAAQPDRLAASGWSALWVHGVAPCPPRFEVTLLHGERANHETLKTRDVRELTLGQHDMVRLSHGGAAETWALTPVRALLDCLRSDENDRSLLPRLGHVIDQLSMSSVALRSALSESGRNPGFRRAARRISILEKLDERA